jgi:hypothetical protein
MDREGELDERMGSVISERNEMTGKQQGFDERTKLWFSTGLSAHYVDGSAVTHALLDRGLTEKDGLGGIITDLRGKDKLLVESDDSDDDDFGIARSKLTKTGVISDQGFSGRDGKKPGRFSAVDRLSVNTGRFAIAADSVDAIKPLASSKSISSNGGSGRKFRIMCIGELMATRYGNVCLSLIGQGPTFCI